MACLTVSSPWFLGSLNNFCLVNFSRKWLLRGEGALGTPWGSHLGPFKVPEVKVT